METGSLSIRTYKRKNFQSISKLLAESKVMKYSCYSHIAEIKASSYIAELFIKPWEKGLEFSRF